MLFFADNQAPRTALLDFLIDHGAAIPAELRASLREAGASASVVDVVVAVGELLYAHAADLPHEGLILGAQFCAYRQGINNWHADPADPQRAAKMALALMRDAGEPAPLGVVYPATADDPAPREDLILAAAKAEPAS